MGWAGTRNGELLRLAEKEFDVFLTVDRGLRQQQDLATFTVAIIVMVAASNRLVDLHPLVPAVLHAQSTAKAGDAPIVGAPK
jgi:hypothetical protein